MVASKHRANSKPEKVLIMATFKKVEELKSELESIIGMREDADVEQLIEHTERYLSIAEIWFKENLKANPFAKDSKLTELEQSQLKSVLTELESLHLLARKQIEKRIK